MQSQDTLILIAEIGVAIAGFSSVFVALNNKAVRHWSIYQRHNLRVLLQVSALAIFFSLFPLVFSRAVDGPQVWNWALGVYAAIHIIDVSTFIRKLPANLPTSARITPHLGLVLAITALAVALLGSPLLAEVLYLCNLVWHLGIAAMGFTFLVMGDPNDSTV